MRSPPASHQFPKSSGAAEEHLGTKPHYMWRPGGAGHALVWIPVMPARPWDMGGRTRRRGASECNISCYVPWAKSPTVQIPQAHGALLLPRLPVNNLTFKILLDTSKLWNRRVNAKPCDVKHFKPPGSSALPTTSVHQGPVLAKHLIFMSYTACKP